MRDREGVTKARLTVGWANETAARSHRRPDALRTAQDRGWSPAADCPGLALSHRFRDESARVTRDVRGTLSGRRVRAGHALLAPVVHAEGQSKARLPVEAFVLWELRADALPGAVTFGSARRLSPATQ